MGRYLHQINGPALGIYQCEPTTLEDIWENYLVYRGGLTGGVMKMMAAHYSRTEQLAWNLKYATAICRIHYLRVPDPLPDPDDVEGLGWYWKEFYNTHLGKGSVGEFVNSYTEMVL